jgi:hypothetical protein
VGRSVDRDDLVVVRLKRDRIAALLLHCVRRPPCCDGAPSRGPPA